MTTMRIRIDGELYTVKELFEGSYLPVVTMETGEEFYLAEDSEAAGKAARQYWVDLAENDPQEFRCIVGDENLIQWALGRPTSPGSVPTRSLEEWFDLTADHPEEEFGSYDGTEREVERCGRLRKELGFCPTVAYRHN